MKDFSRGLSLSFSVIIASLIIGASVITAAKIIAYSIESKESIASAKLISGLAKMITEKSPAWLKEPAAGLKMPVLGSKKVEGVTVGTNPVRGNANASVLIVEFSDFQCPFSKKFYQQSFPQIEKEYIAAGKVKFAYRDFPLGFHAFAKPAAIAARCAGKQGKYWQMFDKILLGSSLDKEALEKYVQELGLNLKVYEECLGKAEIKEEMESDIKDAGKFGVQGTPCFFINGRFVNGAYPFEMFKKIIEEELAKSANKK